VLVLDNDDTFLAKLPPPFVKRNLHSLTALFNSKPSRYTYEIRGDPENINIRYTMFIQSEWSVRDALTNPLWWVWPDAEGEVAVVDKQDKFAGITTRTRLIEGA